MYHEPPAGAARPGLVRRVRAAARRALTLAGRPLARVAVAWSGGVDSTVALEVLESLRGGDSRNPPFELLAVHVDHGWRPESAAEAARLAALAEGRGLVFDACVLDGPAARSETAARRLRWAALDAAAERLGATHLATGHTRSDQAETVLLRVARGTGVRGLAAMRAVGVSPAGRPVVRPLLELSREEVVAYARARGLPWTEDPSNASARHARARVRHTVMPALAAQLNPRVEEALARLAAAAADVEDLLDELARRVTDPDAAALATLPAELRRRVLQTLAAEARGPSHAPRALPGRAVGALARLSAAGGAGRRGAGPDVGPDVGPHVGLDVGLDVGGGVRLRREGGRWRADRSVSGARASTALAAEVTLELDGPAVEVPWAGAAFRWTTRPDDGSCAAGGAHADRVAIPRAGLTPPLVVRAPRRGDRIVLPSVRRTADGARAPGSRLLSDVLGDAKVPAPARAMTPVVADASGRVLWIPGLRRAAGVERPAPGGPSEESTSGALSNDRRGPTFHVCRLPSPRAGRSATDVEGP